MNMVQRQFSKLRQRQFLLYLLVFSLATALVWIGASLFFSQKKTGISAELLEKAKPLTPTISEEVISRLEAKRTFTAEELKNFTIYKYIRTEDGRTASSVKSSAPGDLPLLPDDILDQVSSPVPTASPAPTPASPSVIPQSGQTADDFGNPI